MLRKTEKTIAVMALIFWGVFLAKPGRVFTVGIKTDENGNPLLGWKGDIAHWTFESGTVSPVETGESHLPGPGSSQHSGPAETTKIRTHLMPGQTAILWEENDSAVRSILVSEKPITEDNRRNARILIENILPGSANDWYEDPDECQRTANKPRGWILSYEEKPLERTGGLFVHTFGENDPQELYFAVVGKEEKIQPDRNATTKPIAKKIGNIQPIAQSPAVVESMKNAKKGLPVMLYLHAHQGRPSMEMSHLIFGDETMGWREGLPFKFMVRVDDYQIRIEPFDRVWINRKVSASETASTFYPGYRNIESWWLGTNNQINLPESERKNDFVVNYTERWVLYVLDWVIEHYECDRNRVYASGTSMGTGILRLAMDNPDRFAAVDAMVPLIDMTYDEGKPDMNNTKRFRGIWGSPEITIDGKTPIKERIDLVHYATHHHNDLPYVIVRVGRQDYSVFWRRKPDFFRAMNENRHALLAGWDNGNHSTAMQKKIEHFPNFAAMSWLSERFALNKSYLAVTDYSLNGDPGNGEMNHGDPEGFINRGIDWKVLNDDKNNYQVHVFCILDNADYPISLSLTPRRLQAFKPAPGTKIKAEISDASGKKLQTEELSVDQNGLFSVSGVHLPSPDGVFVKISIVR